MPRPLRKPSDQERQMQLLHEESLTGRGITGICELGTLRVWLAELYLLSGAEAT